MPRRSKRIRRPHEFNRPMQRARRGSSSIVSIETNPSITTRTSRAPSPSTSYAMYAPLPYAYRTSPFITNSLRAHRTAVNRLPRTIHICHSANVADVSLRSPRSGLVERWSTRQGLCSRSR